MQACADGGCGRGELGKERKADRWIGSRRAHRRMPRHSGHAGSGPAAAREVCISNLIGVPEPGSIFWPAPASQIGRRALLSAHRAPCPTLGLASSSLPLNCWPRSLRTCPLFTWAFLYCQFTTLTLCLD